jgi:hypothetical protein
MCTYPLRALSKDGKEVVTFNVEDGPCQLEDNLFILTSRPGSPILRYDSILRGLDIDGLFEGDIFEHEGERFVLQYHRGFAAVNPEKGILSLEEIQSLKVVSNVYRETDVFIPKLVRHTYKSNRIMFTLENIIGVRDGNLILNAKGGLMVPLNNVQQYAGITYNKKTMYFGDTINDSPLILANGRCSISINNTMVDITKGEF